MYIFLFHIVFHPHTKVVGLYGSCEFIGIVHVHRNLIGYKTIEPVAGKQIIHIIRKKVDIAFPHVRLSSEQHNRSKNHVTVSHRSQFHYMYINIRHNCISYLVYTETSRLCPVLFLRLSLCKSPIPSHPYSENPYPSFLQCIFCHLIHRNGQRGTAVSDLCNNTQSRSA